MNLKQLIKEVESIDKELEELEPHSWAKAMSTDRTRMEILNTEKQGIKQTVEAIQEDSDVRFDTADKSKDWQKLKKLLGVR